MFVIYVCVCANRLILHEHLGILDIFPHLVLHQGHISSGPSGYRVLFRSSPQWASIPRWQTYVGAACQSPQLCMGGQSPVEPVVAHASSVVAMVATPQNSGKAQLAAMWKRKPASDAAEETLESSEFLMCFLFMNL